MKTRFKVGQVVWYGKAHMKPMPKECPDCQGSGRWEGETPAGKSFTVKCTTCKQGCESTGIAWENRHVPKVTELTIGKVQTTETAVLQQVMYMCEETGITSGQCYEEEHMFPSKSAAMCYAETLVNIKESL